MENGNWKMAVPVYFLRCSIIHFIQESELMLRMHAMAVLCCGLIVLASAVRAADNELSEQEKKDGWKLLFDGKEIKGWKNRGKEDVTGWAAENGELVCK